MKQQIEPIKKLFKLLSEKGINERESTLYCTVWNDRQYISYTDGYISINYELPVTWRWIGKISYDNCIEIIKTGAPLFSLGSNSKSLADSLSSIYKEFRPACSWFASRDLESLYLNADELWRMRYFNKQWSIQPFIFKRIPGMQQITLNISPAAENQNQWDAYIEKIFMLESVTSNIEFCINPKLIKMALKHFGKGTLKFEKNEQDHVVIKGNGVFAYIMPVVVKERPTITKL